MTKNILLEGDITAADTFTPITTRGSETAPSLQIPAAWSKLTRLIAAVAVDTAAAGSAIFILRLTGPAINGTHDIVIGGGGGQAVQAGSDAPPMAGDNQDFPDIHQKIGLSLVTLDRPIPARQALARQIGLNAKDPVAR